MPHLVIAALLWLAQSPQTPPRPTGDGSIVGRVVDGVSGQRLGGVVVSIAGGGLPSAEKSVTDSDGQFIFKSLPPGRFSFGTKRSGYLDGKLGQRRPGGPSRTLPLLEDERRDDITIEIFKPAAITGTVTDDAGEPVVKVEVRAYRRTFVSGRPVLAPADSDITDDRGMYRIGRLLPGDYVVAVPMVTGATMAGRGTDGARNAVSPGGGIIIGRDGGSSATHLPPSDGKLQKYPTTYYPASQTAAQATVIALDIGEVRRNADVSVRPVKAFNVSGTVNAARGEAKGIELELITAGEDEVGGHRPVGTAIASESGSFSFPAIPAGQYVLRASRRPERLASTDIRAQWTEQLLAVNDKDINDLALFMRAGLKVSGRVVLDGSSDDPNWASGLTVTLDPANARYNTGPLPAATFDASGRAFTFIDILPGRYLVRVTASSGQTVKSITSQGRDAWLAPFAVDVSDVNGIVVTLTDRAASIAGYVTGAGELGESQALVFPQDPQMWTDFGTSPVTVRVLDVSNTGAFEVRGIPAGDYLVVAFDRDTAVDWQSPAFLQSAARFATRVHVGDGERVNTDAKIASIK